MSEDIKCKSYDGIKGSWLDHVSVKLWPHSDMYNWVPFSWIQRTLKVSVWRPSGTLAKEQGSPELVFEYGAQRAH
jgi:hypothetical protein